MKPVFQLKQHFNLLGIAILLAGVLTVFAPSSGTDAALLSRKELLFVWLLVAYGLVFAFVYLIELYFAVEGKVKNTFKDVSLEFKDSKLTSEKEVTEVVNRLTGNKVMEVSMVYDLGGYFKLQAERAKLEKESAAGNKDRIEEIDKELLRLKQDFNKDRSKQATGKGFITFKNFLAAKEFKDLVKEAYRELKEMRTGQGKKTDDSPFDARAAVVSELLRNKKELDSKGSKDTSSKRENELSETVKQATEEQVSTYRRTGTFLPPKAREQLLSDDAVKKQLPTASSPQQTLVDRAEMKKLLISQFGPQFKIGRGIDPETLNFKFTQDKNITLQTHVFYGGIVFILLPLVAYVFNYYFYYIDIGLFVGVFQGVAAKLVKYICLFATVAVDQVAFSVIDNAFTPDRFFKQSRRYNYHVAYYSLYTLISNIIAPNFATKFAFLDYTDRLTDTLRVETVRYLINSAFTVYYVFIFGAVNYKVLRPLLAGKFEKGKLSEVTAHSQIVFNVSFIVSCVFYVAFYGSITPSIFVILTVVLTLNYAFDYYIYQRITFDLTAKAKKTDEGKGGEAKEEVQELPVTLFSAAGWSLVIGVFGLACLGYFGLTLDINQLMKESQLGNENDKADMIQDIAKLVGESASGYSMSLGMAVGGILSSSICNLASFFKALVRRGAYYLVTDVFMFFGAFIWTVLVTLFMKFHNNESLLNRIQSRIWQGKEKVEELKFQGKSYKEINPAYNELKLA